MLMNFIKLSLNDDKQCHQLQPLHHHHYHHRQKQKLQRQQNYCDYQNAFKLFMCVIFLLTFCPFTMQVTMYEGDDCLMASRPGICQLGSKCHTLKEGFKRGIFTTKDVFQCGLAVYEAIVCCPFELPVHVETYSNQQRAGTKERPAVAACRRIDAGLSTSVSQNILDGTPVELGQYPHMAAIGYSRIGNDAGLYDFRCGGTLIDSRFVLTAAHCVNDRYRLPSIVRMGVTNFTDAEQMRDVVEIAIRAFYIHPEYKSSRKYHDIAILELEREVTYSPPFNIYPTCLYVEPEDPPAIFPMYVTGWGSINATTHHFSDILLKARLQLVNIERCNANYKNYGLTRQLKDGIQSTQICASDPVPNRQRDSCHGDSGGPLNVVLDGSKLQYRVAGIVSAGFSCGTDTPGLYTRVSAYLDFIESIVWP